jgi:protocatechuate 3,4-dioxygenase beta subunit
MRHEHWINPACFVLVVQITFAAPPPTLPARGQHEQALKITIGPSKQLGDLGDAGEVDLVVSPTGVVAAFVSTKRWPGREGQLWMAYRVSADGGKTWTGQFQAPMLDRLAPVVGTGRTVGENPTGAIKRVGLWEHMIRPPTWFAARYARFSDDMLSYHVEALRADIREAIVLAKDPGSVAHRTERVLPLLDRGQMIRLSESELLLAMHGKFKGDTKSRAFLIRSLDGGRLWRTFATIGYDADDPDPKLPGKFNGYSEPSIVKLASGKLLAVMRADDSGKPPFKPLYVSWSENRGGNWSKPKPTQPQLFGVSPTLVVLDGGVVACAHARPGLAVAFSTDEGHTWGQEQAIPGAAQANGRIDMVKVGPNKLLTLAAVGSGGTRVFPITVEPQQAERRAKVAAPAEGREILKITRGKPVKLGPYGYVNDATLGVSRTGVIAAGVGVRHWPGMHEQWITYRVSKDSGKTWTEPMQGFGPVRSGAEAWATLRGGGALQVGGWHMSAVEDRKGWWETILTRFSDDMMHYQIETVQVHMPDAGLVISEPSPLFLSGPQFGTGKVIQLLNGDLLSPMQGKFQGDTKHRAIVSRSVDRGRTWRYQGTIAYNPKDSYPELPGQYLGYAEASIALLPNGQLLAVMRTQYTQYTGEYKPLNVCWSDDLGKTWTKPVPTTPHLMNIHPNLIVLDNGVVACVYGRPGFHAVFSLDNGRTWQDRISFSHLAEPHITGQVHANKIGPNKLMVIGGVAAGGTQVFPVTVERLTVSAGPVALTGRVLDEEGNPIAGAWVERGPSRYAADDWLEHETEMDVWKAAPAIVGNPRLAFRSIQHRGDDTTVQTDAQGRFRFDDVQLGEFVFTVEADGYAPQHRHVKVGPQPELHEFSLKPGQLVRGRVVDSKGEPISGVCVVLNRWHCHTDRRGYFHWSAEAPLPQQVTVKAYKRYSGEYETFKGTIPFSQLERQPIILQNQ